MIELMKRHGIGIGTDHTRTSGLSPYSSKAPLFSSSSIPLCLRPRQTQKRLQRSSIMKSPFPDSFKPVIMNVSHIQRDDHGCVIHAVYHEPPNSITETEQEKKIMVLLHGYPQTHTLWYMIVEEFRKRKLLDEWHVLIPDLPGYGRSKKSISKNDSYSSYSKKAVASDIVTLVDQMFGPSSRFLAIGHDRGARVAYRLTKDFQHRVLGLCVMDIVPTQTMWDKMNKAGEEGKQEMFRSYHWTFLALPSQVTETLLSTSWKTYFEDQIKSWTGTLAREAYEPDIMKSWCEPYQQIENIKGAIEDYRAGAGIDCVHDREDVKNGKDGVLCPLLVLYGPILGERFKVADVWRAIAKNKMVEMQLGKGIEVGHFLPTEVPAETTETLVNWMKLL